MRARQENDDENDFSSLRVRVKGTGESIVREQRKSHVLW